MLVRVCFCSRGVVVKTIQILIEVGRKKFIFKENVPITLIYFWILFVWEFSSHSKIFMYDSYRDVTITGEGLQILTYAWHSWSLSSEGSLTCHTYCYTGQPFIMVITEDPCHLHLLPSVWHWSCHYLSCTCNYR